MYIQPLWNQVVRKDWPTKPRNYFRASELGRSYPERYLSMLGVEPTNPFDDRTLRIFDAGNVIEFIVMRALTMAGILNKNQDWVELPETKEHLRVSGRLDATIGGFADWEEARKKALENLGTYKLDLDDQVLGGKANSIIDGLKKEFPNGWPEEMMVEVKSISSMAFWNSKGNKDDVGKFVGYTHNKLQTLAYLHMTGLRQGLLLYVSKDDFTLQEVLVRKDEPELNELLFEDLRTMSRYYRNRETPPLAPEIVYNDKRGKFETNWDVGRSLYLTTLYGYKDADEYERTHHQTLLDINRALKHLKEGKVKPEDIPVIAEYDLQQYLDGV